jgi:hypothetical protein
VTINIPERVRMYLVDFPKLNIFYQDLVKNEEIKHVEMSIIFEQIEKLLTEQVILLDNVVEQNIDDYYCLPSFLEATVGAIMKEKNSNPRASLFAKNMEEFLDNAYAVVNGDGQRQLKLFKDYLVFVKSVWLSIYAPNKVMVFLKQFRKIDLYYQKLIADGEMKKFELSMILWSVDKILKKSDMLVDEVIDRVILESIAADFSEKTAEVILGKGKINEQSIIFANHLSFFLELCKAVLDSDPARQDFLKKQFLVFVKIIWESRLYE